MSMLFGESLGSNCLGFTEVQIRLMIVLFCFVCFFFVFIFMKSYVVGTHYNQLIYKNMQPQQQFHEEISKYFSDRFYYMQFLLGDRFTKDSPNSAGKKKQLSITYCVEIIQDLRGKIK